MANSEPQDPSPEDFGADHIVSTDNGQGGQHNTAYSETGGQYSWDTDKNGDYIDGSGHLSDRNCGGKDWSSWPS